MYLEPDSPRRLSSTDRHPRAALYKSELIGDRAHWEGMGCCAAFIWYLRNTHPILSMFCAHSRHPYGRTERIFSFVTSLGIRAGLTLALLMPEAVSAVDSASSKAKTDESPVGAVALEQFLTTSQLYAVLIGLITSIIEYFLARLAVLDECCCAEYEGGCFKCLISQLGHILMCAICMIAWGAVAVAVLLFPELQVFFVAFSLAFLASFFHSNTWQSLAISFGFFSWTRCRNVATDKSRAKKGKEVVNAEFYFAYHEGRDIDEMDPPFREPPRRSSILGSPTSPRADIEMTNPMGRVAGH